MRGILIELIGDGFYDVHAVYECDHNQDSVIGILVIASPFGIGRHVIQKALGQRNKKDVMKKEETINYPDGNKYVGEVSDGVPNGQGTLIGSGGDEYVGEFRNAKFSGQGTFTHADGRKYSGEWKDNQPNGHGTMNYPDVSTYVGEWKDSKWNGQGTYTWSDGTTFVGKWKDNEPWTGTYCDKDGNVTSTYSEGVRPVHEMEKESVTKVENMEWEGGSYTGEVGESDLSISTW